MGGDSVEYGFSFYSNKNPFLLKNKKGFKGQTRRSGKDKAMIIGILACWNSHLSEMSWNSNLKKVNRKKWLV